MHPVVRESPGTLLPGLFLWAQARVGQLELGALCSACSPSFRFSPSSCLFSQGLIMRQVLLTSASIGSFALLVALNSLVVPAADVTTKSLKVTSAPATIPYPRST